ncbi:MAG: histidine kinase dimerization/phosphoacceptor domain -containing protein [Bacteroidota bacterium]
MRNFLSHFILFVVLISSYAVASVNIEEIRKIETRCKNGTIDSLFIIAKNTDTTTIHGKIIYNWYFSRGYFYNGNFPDAYSYIDKAFESSKKHADKLIQAEIMLDYANTLSQLEQNGDALDLLLNAKKIIESGNDNIQKANFYITLGDFYRKIKELKKGEQFIRKAGQFNNLPPAVIARLNHRLAAIKTDAGQEDSSIFYSEKALIYAYHINDPHLIAISSNELGCIYKDKKNYSTALKYLTTADSLWTKINYVQYAMRARINLATTYRKMNQFKQSNAICLQNLMLCNEKNWTTLELEFCERISSNYESLKMFDFAKDYKIKKLELHVKVLEDRQRVNTRYVEAKFNNAKYEAEIKRQQILMDKDKQELEHEKNEKLFYRILSAFGLLVIIIVSYLAYILRKRKRFIEIEKNKIENYASMLKLSLEEKNALLQEVNHRVKNNLQTISSIMFLQSATLKDKATLATFEDLQRRIEAIAMVHEMLYNSDDVGKICLKKYLEKLIDVNKPIYLTNTNNLSFDIKVPQINFSINTCIALGMITNEAITNAVKHAFTNTNNPIIEIVLQNKTGNEFVVYINDNGKGIDEYELGKTKNTLGTRLMDIFSRKIKGELNIKNSNKGTTVTVNFTENG